MDTDFLCPEEQNSGTSCTGITDCSGGENDYEVYGVRFACREPANTLSYLVLVCLLSELGNYNIKLDSSSAKFELKICNG